MVRTLNPQKRETLLDAALKLFAAKGLQNTSTAEIAREAGAASGTLFIYFPTKQALIDELVMKISRAQAQTIKALLNPHDSARERFLLIWQGSLHWFLDNPDAYLFVQQVRDSNVISPETVQESAKCLDYYFDAIQKGFDEGSIRAYPLELIGGILYQDIVAVMSVLRADPQRREELLQMGFDIFWNGIKSANENQSGAQYAI